MYKKTACLLLVSLLFFSFVAAVSSKTIEYPTADGGTDAQFSVKVLKYEPFPVNPGDWFDLWVKVENVGEDDATDFRAELLSDSTFEVQDAVREYGTLDGTISAHTHKQELGDQSAETNQVLFKYRVRVKNNSLEGATNLQLRLSAKGAVDASIHDLPIDIEKTTTDFSVSLNMVSPIGTTFAISNIGDTTAKAAVVELNGEGVRLLQQYSPVPIGDLPSGGVTTAHLRAVPDAKSLSLGISYTDESNVRTTVEKQLPVSADAIEAATTDFDATLNEITPRETTVAIANIGSFLAKSVTVEVEDEDNAILLEKYAPVSVGDLDSGEVALVHLKLLPKEGVESLRLLIRYTDDAETRRTSERSISLTRVTMDALCPPGKDLSYLFWIYGTVGFLCGAFLILLSGLFLRRRGRR